MISRLIVLCLLLIAGLAGCGLPQPVQSTEAPRLNDDLTAEDIQTLIEASAFFPKQRIPDLPDLFPAPPNWSMERNVPVRELVDEEQMQLEDRWRWSPVRDALPDTRAFDRFLRRRRMSRERLAGVALMVAAALARSTVRDDQNLTDLIAQGQQAVLDLRRDERPYHTLPPEEVHDVLHKAVWITRLDRAARLNEVPPGNVALVRQRLSQLVPLYLPSVLENPFDGIADRQEEQGVPFLELPGVDLFDARDWDRSQAIFGRESAARTSEPRILPPTSAPQ